MLKGEIEILIRDSETMEVVDRIIQPNIVTNKIFEVLTANSGTTGWIRGTIVATSAVMYPSRNCKYVPGNISGNQSVVGTAIPGNGAPDFFPKNGATPAFAQWSTRLGLPASTRTISTVLLTDVNSQSYLDNSAGSLQYYSYENYAYSKLNIPCTQTTTQFFDIYYRVFFPATNQHDMPYWSYEAAIRRMVNDPTLPSYISNMTMYVDPWTTSMPNVTINTGDEEKCWPSYVSMGVPSTLLGGSIVPGNYYRRKFSVSLALTDIPGTIIRNIHTTAGSSYLLSSTAPVDTGQKIQNLLGHRATSDKPLLDIDNLQQGTGSITLGGTWNNRDAAAVPNMFATGKFPEMKIINISGSGAVGASGYTYSKRPFFGSFAHTSFPNFVNTWRQPIQWLPWISQSTTSGNQEIANNLLGDLSKLGVRQLSSWCKYDDTSIVMVKQNKIYVYNIATGTYWTYSAAYTDIRQVTVISGKIYVSCHNTGLWVIDPVNSSAVTAVVPGGGIDLSITYGVARGYNNNLIVVGNNCIARFDGASWTKYDSGTVPAFNIAGVSDANYHNVEYVVVDEESANFNMLLVRRFDATVNSSSLGVWWSTLGVASNTGNEGTTGSQNGNPRVNRSHVGGRNNLWLVITQNNYYKMTFGSSSFTSASSVALASNFTIYQAIMFTKDNTNTTQWLNFSNNGYTSESPNGNNQWVRPFVKLIDSSLAVVQSSASSMCVYTYNPSEIGSIVSSNVGFTNNGDLSVSFELKRGVLFNAAFTSIGFRAHVGVYPFDMTWAGGQLAYIGQTNYGWNGSAWDTATNNPRLTHSSVQNLEDGVTVSFTDGGSGTSFVDTDFYNVVCCEGLMKDSATTATLEHSFYYKKAYRNSTALDAAVIPAPSAQPTGIVGLDAARSMPITGITVNGSNQFVFAGQNPQQAGIGNKQVTGVFDIQYTPFNSALGKNICFGIGHASTGTMLYGFVINNDGIYIYTDAVDGKGPYNTPGPSGWTSHGSYGTFSTALDLRIKRDIAGVLSFYVQNAADGVPLLKFSVTPPLTQQRFDLICSPWSGNDPLTWLANRTCPATNILLNGTDAAVKVGTLAGVSGAYNPLFYAIDNDSRNNLSVVIGGTPALAYRAVTDNVPAAAGEVSVDPYMGLMHFNAADVGKTVSATYTYMTHE